ncbi:MAG: glycosyltransferase family 9 protein [Opitutaceae bacterium]|nr:glycosyltransferase family 9 protein [Opitutaceae bacterium]
MVKTSSLGDIIQGLRVVASLKEQIEGLHVTWVARDVFAPIVRSCTAVDETIVFRRRPLISGLRQVFRELRDRTFDVVMDMQGRYYTGFITARAKAPRKIGRRDRGEGTGLFYTDRVDLPPLGKRSHAVAILLEFCRSIGVQARLPRSVGFQLNGIRMPAEWNQFPKDRLIVMFPDSRREEKCWAGFSAITDSILGSSGELSVAWAGDRALAYTGDQAGNARFLNLTGKTALGALTEIIGSATWVIANDSGPLHLAAAQGRKVLGIFGPTEVALFGPYPPDNGTNFSISAPARDLRLLTPREVMNALGQIDPSFFGTVP